MASIDTENNGSKNELEEYHAKSHTDKELFINAKVFLLASAWEKLMHM